MSARCRQLRKARGWTQSDLGQRAGVEAPQISNFENGKDKVTLRLVRRIAKALDVSVAELFMDERELAEAALLDFFRSADPAVQQFLLDHAKAFASKSSPGTPEPDDRS